MNEVAAPAVRPSAPPRALPEFSIRVKLNTEFAQRVHHRCFDRLKGDLYVLTVRTLSGGMDEAATAIETILSETFVSVRKDLDNELERADALLDAVKLNELAAYDGVSDIEATFSTPRAKEFLDLLLKMDQLLMRYDALWLAGHIETRQRWTRCQNWQRRLTKVANRLRELGNRTRSGLTRESEKRAAGTNATLTAAASTEGSPPLTEAITDGAVETGEANGEATASAEATTSAGVTASAEATASAEGGDAEPGASAEPTPPEADSDSPPLSDETPPQRVAEVSDAFAADADAPTVSPPRVRRRRAAESASG